MKYSLRCARCSATTNDYSSFRCHVCHGILEVEYDYSRIALPKDFKHRKINNAKYTPLFPVNGTLLAGMGEGGTSLRREPRLANGSDLYLKIETTNPTMTFKDRGSAVEITKALELGFGRVCCASTGNMGFSIARYAKKHGIKADIFISSDADMMKVNRIRREGASVVGINGDFNKALKEAELFAASSGAFVCGDYHYRKEGQKSVAFEIVEQLGYKVPDYIFVPVGNATLISAIYKGLREFRRLGLIGRRLPRLVAVQSENCDPVVKAFQHKKEIVYSAPHTIADAIAVGYPTFGFECMRALHETGGMAIAVADKDIRSAVSELRRNGIAAELGGATAYAGFKNLSSKILKGKKVIVVVTGNK